MVVHLFLLQITFQDVNVTKSNLLLGDGRLIFRRSVLFGSTITQEFMRNVVIGRIIVVLIVFNYT